MSELPPLSRRPTSKNSSVDHPDFIFFAAVGGSLCLMGLALFAWFIWKCFFPESVAELPVLAGVYGDFLSGVLGPLLSLVGIYFVVLTLREQRVTITAEREGEVVQAFQNKYYQLVRMHRQNVAEMQLSKRNRTIRGRKVFVSILGELELALSEVRNAVEGMTPPVTPLEQVQIAYYVVFFGIGRNSSTQMREALQVSGCRLVERQFEELEWSLRQREEYATSKYFEGHQSRLGHYFRHLYQTISYVDEQTLDIVKAEYTKTVRAQLSTHEQALLLINSLSPLGWNWWSKGFLVNYAMVKNIPKGFLEEYCSFAPSDLFPEGYFEWQEIRKKPKELDNFKFSDQ